MIYIFKSRLLQCWWDCKGCHCYGKMLWGFLNEIKIELPYDPEISLLDIYPKELKAGPWGDSPTSISTAASFRMAKRWKQSKCSSPDEWASAMWYVQIVKYYSALKRKDIVTWCNPRGCYTKWNEPVNKETHTAWFHFCEVSRVVEYIHTENRMVVAKGWGKGAEEVVV